jgi:hypothetical protein
MQVELAEESEASSCGHSFWQPLPSNHLVAPATFSIENSLGCGEPTAWYPIAGLAREYEEPLY